MSYADGALASGFDALSRVLLQMASNEQNAKLRELELQAEEKAWKRRTRYEHQLRMREIDAEIAGRPPPEAVRERIGPDGKRLQYREQWDAGARSWRQVQGSEMPMQEQLGTVGEAAWGTYDPNTGKPIFVTPRARAAGGGTSAGSSGGRAAVLLPDGTIEAYDPSKSYPAGSNVFDTQGSKLPKNAELRSTAASIGKAAGGFLSRLAGMSSTQKQGSSRDNPIVVRSVAEAEKLPPGTWVKSQQSGKVIQL